MSRYIYRKETFGKATRKNTTPLLFSLKRFEILHQERRSQVKIIVIEHFNIILFRKSGPANKQRTYQSINQTNKQSINELIDKSVHPSIHPSTHPSIHPSIHPPIYQSINQSINQSLCFMISNHYLNREWEYNL